MKFEVTQSNFNKMLSLVSRIASSKTPLPILNNILIKATKSQILIAATDLEVAISAIIPGRVETTGSLTIPARLLSEYVASLPSGNMVFIQDGAHIEVKSGRYQSTFNGASAEDFPALPDEPTKHQLNLPGSVLRRSLQQTTITVSHDETRPVLTGLFLHTIDDKIYLAGTDGYRLAERQISKSKEEIKAIIPINAMNDLSRILQDIDEEVVIGFDEGQISFKTDNITLISRLIDGEYPPYRQLIPSKSDTSFVVAKSDLLTITKVASLFARESAGSITIHVEDKEVRITSVASQMGENTSSAEAKTSGLGSVTVNSRYLLDAIGCLDGEEINFRFSGKISPCVLNVVSDDSYQHIIMPLKS